MIDCLCYVNYIHGKLYIGKKKNTRVRKHNLRGLEKGNEGMVLVVDVY